MDPWEKAVLWSNTDVVLLQRWSYYRGGPITEVVLLQRWSYYRGGPITEVVLLQRWSYYRGGPITEVVLLQRWSYYRGGPITEVVLLQRWSYYRSGPITELVYYRGSLSMEVKRLLLKLALSWYVSGWTVILRESLSYYRGDVKCPLWSHKQGLTVCVAVTGTLA